MAEPSDLPVRYFTLRTQSTTLLANPSVQAQAQTTGGFAAKLHDHDDGTSCFIVGGTLADSIRSRIGDMREATEAELREAGLTADEIDPSRYAACERQKVDDGWRYVRLHEEPMDAHECLPWLIEQGYVKRVPEDHPGSETGFRLAGWGSTYFMVPWDKAVER